MTRKLIIISFLIAGTFSVTAQEIVKGLYSDRQVKNAWNRLDHRKSFTSADTLDLPFFDDFSQSAVYPDQSKWEDNYVFINNTYSVKQRTQGVATFDAIDNNGILYLTATPLGFEADHLTSLPIRLNYSPADSVYLSFLYEPGGIADPPELQDSLTLQFYAPVEDKWYSVWKAPGSQSDTFRAAIIRIENPAFLKAGFRFRFINYASLSASDGDPSMLGNCDQWNVDYICLKNLRTNADTVFRDVAFTKPVRSSLKTYEAMPWKQFRMYFLSEMGPYITINYFNNDTVVQNPFRYFEVYDMYKNTVVHNISSSNVNIEPLSLITYNANLIYTFNTDNPDSGLFRIKSWLGTGISDPKANDTITYLQRFTDYYAFDDGTSESGYGINGLGSRNAMVAYRYNSPGPDTIRGVRICFNESLGDANYKTFNLMVWADDAGVPGTVLSTETGVSVKQGPDINGFRTYTLSNPVVVNGNYYVGWQQLSESFLNAGFDLNTPHQGRLMYYLNGNWNVSQTKGSVMIRPVFGPRISTTGIDDIRSNLEKLRFWPNPAGDYIYIDNQGVADEESTTYRISDIQGREIIRSNWTERIDVSSLMPGIYILTRYEGNRATAYGRVVKTR